MSRRSRGTLSTDVKKEWTFIYRILSVQSIVVYIGQTCREKRRKSAHESEASSCSEVVKFIGNMRQLVPGWKFSDYFERVPGLSCGVPGGAEADKWEWFMIQSCRKGGSLRTGPNLQYADSLSPPCNLYPGFKTGRFTQQHYDECQRALSAALTSGTDVYSEEDVLEYKLANARADSEILCRIIKEGEAQQVDLPDVTDCLTLARSRAEEATNAIRSSYLVDRRIETFKSKLYVLNRQDLAMWCNDLCDVIEEHKRHWKQGTHADGLLVEFHDRAVLDKLRWMVKENHNGECATSTSLTKDVVLRALLSIRKELIERERAKGVPFHTFNSLMAWANPDTRFVETNSKKLKRVDDVLASCKLAPPQKKRAGLVRDRIRAAIQKEKEEAQEEAEGLSAPMSPSLMDAT